MPDATYIVRANRLNFRDQPGLESNVLSQLANGTVVEFVSGDADSTWWEVRPRGSDMTGYVARRYLAAISTSEVAAIAGANEILWETTEKAIAAEVRYRLGEKHSSSGFIDCSGWVAETTLAAFARTNAAAAPEVVFDQADNKVFRTHSDGIVTGIQARTGFLLRGPQVTSAALRDGMLIGLNFGDYGWEQTVPPRRYGIDHIVQVVSDPATGAKKITQSSGSGKGVNLQPLDGWLDGLAAKKMIEQNRVYAVDPFLLADPHTQFAQSWTTPTPVPNAPAPAPAWVSAGSPTSFRGRGMWIYTLEDVLSTYLSIENCVREMQRCRLNHIWVRIHGRNYIGDAPSSNPQKVKDLIAAARQAGIAVAGWGWCQGDDIAGEIALAAKALSFFDLTDYVADIEQRVSGAFWTPAEVLQFITGIRSLMEAGAGLGISSHGFIDYQDPKIFARAAALIDCLNPQAYWYTDKPNSKMLAFVKASAANYPLRNPAAYVKLCFDRWSKLYNRPIVLSGQTCPEADLTPALAPEKLAEFLRDFRSPAGLVGLNFWHWGSTTRAMRDELAAAP